MKTPVFIPKQLCDSDCRCVPTALKPFGISVTTIAPGYIDTEKLRQLNQNDLSKKPFLTDLGTATLMISEAIEKQKNSLFSL
jgi:NAD(P)-dependent dehydrogenase (short-subunit alcohol dehydrogenase family)